MATFVFKVEGGSRFGMGRVLRSLALAREIRRLQAAPISFFVNDDAASLAAVQTAGFPAEIAPQNPDEFAQQVVQENAAVLTFDQESEVKPFSDSLRARSNVRLLALDCFEMENDGLHVIVNLLNHSPRKRPMSEDVVYFEGLEYAIVRSEFDEHIARDRSVKEQAQRLLVSFGGADPRSNTLRVLQAVKGIQLRNLHLDVTVGANFSDSDTLEARAAELQMKVRLHREPRNFPELMHRADTAVIGGGTTLLEAAALGTPAVVLAQTVFEARFCQVFEAAGAALSLGVGGKCDGDTIRRELLTLLGDRVRRLAMSAAGRKLVDGLGRQRLVAIVVQQAVLAHAPLGSHA